MRRNSETFYLAILALAAIALAGPRAVADVVITTNGSRIVGKLERMGPDGAVIVTEFAGKLQVPADKVASITTDQQVTVQFDSGDRLIGTLVDASNGDGVVMKSSIGDIPVERERMTDVWPEGSDSPDVVVLKKKQAVELAAVTPTWTVTLEGGATRKEGNTDKLEGHGRLEVKRKTSLDLLTFFMYGEYSEENKVRSDNEYGGGIRYESRFEDSRDYFWYSRLRLEHDEFEDLDLRATVAAGVGKYWIDKPDRQFRTDVGVGYRSESNADGTDSDDALVDLGLDYRIDLAPWVQFTHESDFTPTWDDFGDYLLRLDTALIFPFQNEEFKLKVGMRNEYDSRPVKGSERLDNTYYTSIVLSIKS